MPKPTFTPSGLVDTVGPPPFIQPEISADGWLTIPQDVGYPYTRERLELVRRE